MASPLRAPQTGARWQRELLDSKRDTLEDISLRQSSSNSILLDNLYTRSQSYTHIPKNVSALLGTHSSVTEGGGGEALQKRAVNGES